MSEWVDQPSLPGPKEFIYIKEEIVVLESKMEEELQVVRQAQLRLAKLTREWEERKASIAPVKRANFDVLSIIFELCSQVDSRAPLRIGAVSRYWRAVVLRTPRSWRFLDAINSSDACCEAYLERSGEQDLHVNLSNTDELAFIATVAHRVQCIAIANDTRPLKTVAFPRLTRLVLSGDDWYVDPSVIMVSCFPNLRHLELRYALHATSACLDLPPLQSLIITVRDDDGWPQVMLACNSSLRSLKITILQDIERWELKHINDIHLPKLLYLRIVDTVRTDRPWWVEWDTPALETFIEDHRTVWAECRRLESKTAYMRLARPPMLSTPSEVRVLQLDLVFDNFCWFLGQLKENACNCPRLKHLEFGISNMSESEAANAASMLFAWARHGLPNRMHPLRMTNSWSVELPGENEMQCGNGMPCVDWSFRH